MERAYCKNTLDEYSRTGSERVNIQNTPVVKSVSFFNFKFHHIWLFIPISLVAINSVEILWNISWRSFFNITWNTSRCQCTARLGPLYQDVFTDTSRTYPGLDKKNVSVIQSCQQAYHIRIWEKLIAKALSSVLAWLDAFMLWNWSKTSSSARQSRNLVMLCVCRRTLCAGKKSIRASLWGLSCRSFEVILSLFRDIGPCLERVIPRMATSLYSSNRNESIKVPARDSSADCFVIFFKLLIASCWHHIFIEG